MEVDTFESTDATSHLLSSLIDQIELILTSPADFTSSTPQTLLAPLLSEINTYDYDVEQDRINRVEKWCNQLSDATRAAFARETITEFLNEIESWEEWQWNSTITEVSEKKSRVEEIKRTLSDLPIEWLKTRVIELRKLERELHPPAYLTIHITFSLLPPLSTLHAHLQVYKVRFRVWDISQTFFSIITTLKSFITIPSIFSREENSTSNSEIISATEALALTVEAGLLLDRMIDISVDEKGLPIPDEWIDEFERIEQTIGRITKEDIEPETPCPVLWTESPMELSPEISRHTRSSIVESIFSSPRSERLDDSMSSIEDDLPSHLRVKHGEDEDEDAGDLNEREGSEDDDFDLAEELRRDDERVFEKEYHVIATPPEQEPGEVDHSPFLARVIAEMESLDPLESLQRSHSPANGETDKDVTIVKYSDDDESIGNIENLDRTPAAVDDEVDVDALYEAMVNGDDSDEDDEYSFETLKLKNEIRTSSPVFDDHELNYEELESSDDDNEEINDDETARFDRTIILDTIDDDEDIDNTTQRLNHISLDPFSSPERNHTPRDSDSDIDETVTLPRSSPRKHPIISRTPSPPLSLPPSTPAALKDSQLHSKVTQIVQSHPTIALIPQTSTFRPTQSSEYGYYTLRPQTSHSRHSSVSSNDTPEPARRVDVGGANLYVRILSDRVMVRVGGGWVDLEQYLKEYVGKREYRRRSGSVASTPGEFEILDLDEGSPSLLGGKGSRNVSTPPTMRSTSSLGLHGSPPRGSSGGRISALEFRRSVSPGISEDGSGSIGRAGGTTRRVFVSTKMIAK